MPPEASPAGWASHSGLGTASAKGFHSLDFRKTRSYSSSSPALGGQSPPLGNPSALPRH